MIAGVKLKVCGVTTLAGAELADQCGADCLGFNLYPDSARHIPLAQFQAMAPQLPSRLKVAVMVAPTPAELAAAVAAGFDAFQIHFTSDTPLESLRQWSGTVGADRLWLAPKLPPAEEVNPAWLPLAGSFLLDTFHAEGFGGSGRTGDWRKFAHHQQTYPEKNWILAGGLNPDNVAVAVTCSGATFVDVASGVESSPGVKDAAKLRRFVDNLSVHRE